MTSPQPVSRGRRPWLAPLLLLFFLTVPVVEVWMLIRVGQRIGFWPTLGLLLASALIGTWLMRREGAKAWQTLNESLSSGRLPGRELLDPVLILIGGFLVVLPGFFTDVIGLIFLLPFTRPLARGLLQLFIARRAAKSGIDLNVMSAKVERDTVIRGETVPDDASGEPRTTPQPGDPTVIKGEIEP